MVNLALALLALAIRQAASWDNQPYTTLSVAQPQQVEAPLSLAQQVEAACSKAATQEVEAACSKAATQR
jgi:hypothetical protein